MLMKPQFFYDHTTKQALGFQNPFYLKKAQKLEPKLYDGNVIKNNSTIVIPDSEETLMLAEESRSNMLLKQQDPMMLENKVNTTPVDYAVLNQLSKDFETRFVPQTETYWNSALCLLEKVLVITALKNELRKLKGKSVIACRETVNKPKVIVPVVHKVELEPLFPKLKNNSEAHVDYIRITKENADTLRDVVEQARTSNPLDNSEKLVVVTPMNKARKVTFAKTSTTSDNNTQIQVDVHQTQTTNKPLVPSTNEKCSTNASRSKLQSETKNNMIMQPLSSNQKYQKVEAHTRDAKPSLTKEDSESKSVCLTCNKYFFYARHDLCVEQYLSEVNDRARAKAVKNINTKEWKPTGNIHSTKIVPPRKPVKSTVITNIKPSSASQRRPTVTNHASSSSAPKIVESRTANHLEPNNHMRSNVSISTFSSSVQCRFLNTASLGPPFHEMTPAKISSGLVPNLPPLTSFVPPLRTDWDLLFQLLFGELLTPPPSLPSSTTVDQDAPSRSNSQTTPETQSPVIPNEVEEDNHDVDLKKALLWVETSFSRMVYNLLSRVFLLSQEFSKGTVDPTLFIRRQGKDILLISQSSRGIFINQSKYALESLKKYGMESSDPVDTPMAEKSVAIFHLLESNNIVALYQAVVVKSPLDGVYSLAEFLWPVSRSNLLTSDSQFLKEQVEKKKGKRSSRTFTLSDTEYQFVFFSRTSSLKPLIRDKELSISLITSWEDEECVYAGDF
ncbi:hypothetical protein Tco_0189111 [Tanacetum coccineum]